MNKLKNLLKKQGFTLVELIIVIAIIAVLAVVAFMMLTKWLGKSRDSRKLADIETVSKSLMIWMGDSDNPTGLVPTPDDESEVKFDGTHVFTQGVFGETASAAIDSIQKAPTNTVGDYYAYSRTTDGRKYQIATELEDGTVSTALLDIANAGESVNKMRGNFKPGIYVFSGMGGGAYGAVYLPSIVVANGVTGINLDGTNQNFVLDGNGNNLIETAGNLASYSEAVEGVTEDLGVVWTGNLDILSSSDINGIIDNLSGMVVGTVDAGLVQGMLSAGGTVVSSSSGGEEATYSCQGSLVTANADISNNTGLTGNTVYQTDTPSENCYYICKDNYSGINCDIEPLITNTDCESAGWFWVDDATDTIGNGFCISPRIEGGTDGISWGDIGTNHGWTRTGNTTNLTSASASADNGDGLTYDLGNYTCTPLGNAIGDFDTTNGEGDTLYNRMKWLVTNKTDSSALDDIDWVNVPDKPTTLSVPAIMLSDCIDGIRDLDTGKIYDTITYADYSNPTNDSTSRIKMNKYLLGWTKATGSHLPSAFSDISSEKTNNLTTNKGEYQIACENNGTIGGDFDTDSTSSKRIWLSSIGDINGNNWGHYARIIGSSNCKTQSFDYAGDHNSVRNARFVVR